MTNFSGTIHQPIFYTQSECLLPILTLAFYTTKPKLDHHFNFTESDQSDHFKLSLLSSHVLLWHHKIISPVQPHCYISLETYQDHSKKAPFQKMFFSFPKSFDKRHYSHPSGAIDPKVAYSPPQLWNDSFSLGVPKNLDLTSLY